MSGGPRLASVSVDLDGLGCYWRIHGLDGSPPEGARHVVLRRCLRRFADLFDKANLRATFFVVGSDLADDEDGRAVLARLAARGHELANHTFSHPYDFTRRSRAAVADEIDRAHDAIAGCGGRAPVGFRAPGYAISGEALELLCERSYRYDSSAFPSWPYYGAKAAVMGAMRAIGRRSASVLDSPRVLTAPRMPYRPAREDPYRRGSLPILELPMAVTPTLRLPVIGTSTLTAPAWLRQRLVASAARGQELFNFELHGIDLADAADDQIPAALIAKQPDLRLPLARKRAALEATIAELQRAGTRFVTLAEAAADVEPLVSL